MQDIKAVALSRSEVLITLGVPEPEEPARMPAGFVIVRTIERFPDGPDDPDGEIIKKTLGGETDRIEITDSGLSPFTVYRYGVWAYGADELSDHYTYSGTDSTMTLDPSADLETITAFSAWPHSRDQVYLEWRYSESGLVEPQSVLIVRREGSEPPGDIFDGTTVHVQPGKTSLRDYGAAYDVEYVYGVWPADEDGTPYLYGQSNTEPLLTVTVVIEEVSLLFQATDIVIVQNTGAWNDNPSSLQVQSTSSPLSAALIRFDLSEIDGKYIGTIDSAELLLISQTVTSPGEVDLFRTIIPWDSSPAYSWVDVNTEGYFYADDGYDISVSVDQPGTTYAWYIADIFDVKTDGFLLTGGTIDQAAVSFANSGVSGPKIDLRYFGEP